MSAVLFAVEKTVPSKATASENAMKANSKYMMRDAWWFLYCFDSRHNHARSIGARILKCGLSQPERKHSELSCVAKSPFSTQQVSYELSFNFDFKISNVC